MSQQKKEEKSHIKRGTNPFAGPSSDGDVLQEGSQYGSAPFNWQGTATGSTFNPWTVSPAQFSQEIEPPTIMFEENDHLVIAVELPEISREDIQIQWIRNMIVITGEKESKAKQLNAPILWSKGYWSGKFRQTINLGFQPESSKAFKVDLLNGVLTIKVGIPVNSKTQVI